MPETRLVDGQVPVESAIGGQLARVDGGQLGDGALVEGDLLVDGVAAGAREVAIVFVDAEERRDLGTCLELLAEPAIDRAVETGIGIGREGSHRVEAPGGREPARRVFFG